MRVITAASRITTPDRAGARARRDQQQQPCRHFEPARHPIKTGGYPQRAKESRIDLGPMKLTAPAPIITTPSAIEARLR
jgi:hypothetical protein